MTTSKNVIADLSKGENWMEPIMTCGIGKSSLNEVKV